MENGLLGQHSSSDVNMHGKGKQFGCRRERTRSAQQERRTSKNSWWRRAIERHHCQSKEKGDPRWRRRWQPNSGRRDREDMSRPAPESLCVCGRYPRGSGDVMQWGETWEEMTRVRGLPQWWRGLSSLWDSEKDPQTGKKGRQARRKFLISEKGIKCAPESINPKQIKSKEAHILYCTYHNHELRFFWRDKKVWYGDMVVAMVALDRAMVRIWSGIQRADPERRICVRFCSGLKRHGLDKLVRWDLGQEVGGNVRECGRSQVRTRLVPNVWFWSLHHRYVKN